MSIREYEEQACYSEERRGTAVTPSKPNFQHISLRFIIVVFLLEVFTLVLTMAVMMLIERVTLI
jgi:hypothetical protein